MLPLGHRSSQKVQAGPVQSASRKPPVRRPHDWHFGPRMTWDLAVPRPPGSFRSWKPPARSAAAPCSEPWTGTAPPTRAGTSSLPPCTPAPRLPGGRDRHLLPARLFGCSPGWGREAPRRFRNARVRPCLGYFFYGEVGECRGG